MVPVKFNLNWNVTVWKTVKISFKFFLDPDKSCNQLLTRKIVLRYRGHLHEESLGGIFWYSKEWKKIATDIVSKSLSTQNTHLTGEPILKQCAVYGSRPPIASKPGATSLEQYGLNNITSQPWPDATYRLPPLMVLTSALSRSFTRKGQDKVPKTMVWG